MEFRNTLCEKCSMIPFQPGLQNFFEDHISSQWSKGRSKWNLGPLSRLRASSCPFCKLVRSVWDDEENTYRLPIRVYWTGSDFRIREKPAFRIIMVKEYVSKDAILCARKRLSSWIEFEEIRRWLSRCIKGHLDCRGPDRTSLTFNKNRFRLIDVDQNCVVEAVKCERYVALSYVWGDSNDGRLLLNQKTISSLLCLKSLETFQSAVPSTIKDAISATKSLGERYLWVDSLCIVQDDPDELRECTSLMDRIYQEALVTIVSAHGADAHSGLPGVRPTPRDSGRIIQTIVPGLEMTVIEDLDTCLRESTYSNRGWT